MSTEPSKFPIESAPQKTYTHSLRGFFRSSLVAVVLFGIICLCITGFIWGLVSWIAIFIPFFMMPLPVYGLIVSNRRKKGFITISPEGLTFGGALNVNDGIKSDFSREDFNKVSHFGWEHIVSVGFTRDIMKPSYLFVELTDGETYYFPLWCYEDDIFIIDNLRRFTGYSGCKDLGRYIPYVKELRSKDAGAFSS